MALRSVLADAVHKIAKLAAAPVPHLAAAPLSTFDLSVRAGRCVAGVPVIACVNGAARTRQAGRSGIGVRVRADGHAGAGVVLAAGRGDWTTDAAHADAAYQPGHRGRRARRGRGLSDGIAGRAACPSAAVIAAATGYLPTTSGEENRRSQRRPPHSPMVAPPKRGPDGSALSRHSAPDASRAPGQGCTYCRPCSSL